MHFAFSHFGRDNANETWMFGNRSEMVLIQYISNLIIPILIFYVIGYGLLNKVAIFDAFVKGAEEGFKVVLGVLPTLIGLMMAIGLLRESGLLEKIAQMIEPAAVMLHFPASLVPLTFIKMISSSASTGLLIDIYKEFGTDSREGYMASLFMCCSETILYTISVYFMATGDAKHRPISGMRWTLVGALICTFAGIVASVLLTGWLVG